MDLDRAIRVFREYCRSYRRDRLQAESLLLTDEERQAILGLKDLIKECADLFGRDEHSSAAKAA